MWSTLRQLKESVRIKVSLNKKLGLSFRFVTRIVRTLISLTRRLRKSIKFTGLKCYFFVSEVCSADSLVLLTFELSARNYLGSAFAGI